MRNYTFNFELKTMMEQFVAAFNDIIIKGYDNKNTYIPGSEKNVNFVYSPKQRVYASLVAPGPGAMQLPVIAVSFGTISRDKSRVFNKNNGFILPADQPKSEVFLKRIPQPIPVDVTVNMTIVTKYQEHMDQIISNFVPYCDPYIVISWKFPGLENSSTQFEIRSEVLWSGIVNTSYPKELNASQNFMVTADTSFTIKGWMFKKFDEPYKKIFYIDSDYSATSHLRDGDTLLKYPETEYFSISACPFIKAVFPQEIFTPNVSATTFDIYGKYLIQPLNVYLSASNPLMFNNITTFSPFISSTKLSSVYTPFKAVSTTFNAIDDQHIEISFPEIPAHPGFVDIIVENEAGYGKLNSYKLQVT